MAQSTGYIIRVRHEYGRRTLAYRLVDFDGRDLLPQWFTCRRDAARAAERAGILLGTAYDARIVRRMHFAEEP